MAVKKIETQVWVPSKEHPGCVEYKGQRNAREVYTDIRDLLKAEDLMPDEYFLIGNKFDDITVEVPKVVDVICYAKWGGSEGIYLHVDFIVENNIYNNYETVNFAVGKSLKETTEAFDRMQYIAGRIYRAFMGDGTVHERYIKITDK